MEKSLLKYVLTSVLACVSVMASAQVWVGYCDEEGEMTSSISSSNLDATVSVASAILPDMFDGLPQCVVRTVAVGLYQVNGVGSLTVWVANHLGGERLAQVEADVTALSTGWNTFTLPEEVNIPQSGDTLYVGIDYTQTIKSVKAVATSGKKGTANAFWAGSNGKWQDRSSSYKPACLMVGAYRTSGHDIHLADAWITENRYQEQAAEGKPVKVSGVVQNAGSDTLRGFRVRATSVIGNEVVPAADMCFSCELGYMQKGGFELEFVPDMSAPHRNVGLTIDVLRTDGLEEEDASDNVQSLYYDVAASTTGMLTLQEAGIMTEQYVSLRNGWSVLGQQHVDEVIDQYASGEGAAPVVLLTHHRGYGPADSLAISDKGDYTARAMFGKDELCYAPAVSFDRNVMLSSTLLADSLSMVFSDIVARKVPHTAIRSLQLSGNGNECEVRAEVESTSYAWCENPVLMAALVRNEVSIDPGSQKRYDADNETEWTEKNVVVKYLTSSRGISLIDGSADAQKVIRDITEGRVPSPETGTAEYVIDFTLPEGTLGTDETHPEYSVVLWVCNMTDDDRSVDCVKKVSF